MCNLIILDTERKNFPSSNKFLADLYKKIEEKYLMLTYFLIIPKIKKELKRENCKVIATDKETELILKEKNIPYNTLKDYISDKEFLSYEKKCIDFIRNIPLKFPEIDITYLGLSLWDIDVLDDIYLTFARPMTTNIEFIDKIIKIEKPKNLIIFNSSTKLGLIQKKFIKKVNIIDKTDLISNIRTMIFKFLTPLAVKTIHSGFIKKINKNKYHPKTSKEVIFFESERVFKYCYKSLKTLKDKVTILQDQEYQKKEEEFDYDLLKNYISPSSKKNCIQFRKVLKNKYKLLKKSSHLKQELNYNNIPLYDLMDDLFAYLFNSSYFKSAYYFECCNNFLEENRPKLVIIMCEGPKRQRVMINLTNKLGIKSLLIMHGTIGERDVYDNLISDFISVYGNYYKKVLINKKNESRKIIVTGNPAWDHIKDIKITKEELYKNLKLPPKKYVLAATTHFPWDTRNRLGYATIKTMTKFPELHLIIKLHPEEKPDYYLNLLRKFELEATLVNDSLLLYPLIKHSELVIITDSTVGVETILLDKPLIDLNLTIVPYWNDYVNKNVAISVKKEEDLLPVIKSILKNKTVRAFKKNRKKFIYEHTYKQDNEAFQRVAKLINEISKKP